jgi:hypothetical protein
MFKRTIGADKLNQLRHVRFLKNEAGLMRYMDAYRPLLAPKFAAVQAALDHRLAGTGAATWTHPKGGYFISLDATSGTARRVVTLARDAGLALTAAGSTWPHGNDPDDSNLRLARHFRRWRMLPLHPRGSRCASCSQRSKSSAPDALDRPVRMSACCNCTAHSEK